MRLKDLTVGEKFFLDRWRRRESMGTASERLEMSYDDYRDMERDKAGKPKGVKVPALGAMTDGERCRVARWRDDRKVEDVSKKAKLSSHAIRQMERENLRPDKLLRFWGIKN